MTNREIQEEIQANVKNLLKGPPELLRALAKRANEAEQSVAYFAKIKDKNRVRYEMHSFLKWLKKTMQERGQY